LHDGTQRRPGLRQQISALNFPTAIVDEADKDTFRREMADAEILLHVLEPVTAAVIDAAPHLRLIQKIGIGVNTIDLDAARRRGIAVCNMPGTNTQAVAEMTLLLMLATLRRLAQLDRLTRAGKGWKLDPELSDDLGELSGRTVGLVGFGEPSPRRRKFQARAIRFGCLAMKPWPLSGRSRVRPLHAGTESLRTLRWRKADSNSWSHPERNGNGRAPAPTSIILRDHLSLRFRPACRS
jgi:phosphoglycerate dehydrogenase-like enzyme